MATKQIRAVDLFCGAGGTSQGLARACHESGVDVDLVAINHWETAVNTHAKNHPWARHFLAPVESVNPREAFPDGVVDLLCASPECTHHSTARGGKPTNDQLRSSAWHIMRWLTELDVRNVLIENVPEFKNWGPVSQRTGRPIKSRKGRYFKIFVDTLDGLGYTVEHRVLNAADYGDPTSRRRLFIMACKGSQAPVWPRQSHSKRTADGEPSVPGTLPWCSARSIIDWTLKGESIFTREQRGKRPLSPRTMEKILTGLERYGGPALEPFLVLLRGTSTARSVDDPLPALTAGGQHVALAQPVLLPPDGPGGNGQYNHARSIDEPLPTIRATRGGGHLIQPVLLPYNGNSQARSVDEPMPTATTVDRLGLAEAFLIPHFGERKGQSPRTHGLDAPLPTVTSHGAGSLVEPHIMHVTHGGRVRDIDEPLPTVTGANRGELALVQPVVDGHVLDIRLRMLQPHELARGMGFGDEYEFIGNKRDRVKQIGNAVAVNMSQALITSLLPVTEQQPSNLTANQPCPLEVTA